MNEELETDPARDRARRRTRELQLYSLHLLVFVLGGTALFVIDFLEEDDTAPRIDWASWVLILWGLGFAMHTVATYAGVIGRDWERRKLAELDERRGPESGKPRPPGEAP